MKTLRQLLAAALAVSTVAGCAAQATVDTTTPRRGGELVIASMPTALDPVYSTLRSNWLAAATMCEGLWENDARMGVHNGLAESYHYDGATTYTVRLRGGLTFHDGQPLRAEDVAASLRRYAGSSPGATFGKILDQVSAADDLTVVIKLKQPSSAVPALLSTPDTAAYVMPASLVTGVPSNKPLPRIVCTGPYQLREFVPDRQVILDRFDGYQPRAEPPDGASGAKTAYADRVKFVPYNESNVLNQLRTDAVDIALSGPLMDQLPSYRRDDKLTPVVVPGGQFRLVQFNLKQGPATNLELRQAVQRALDPKQIALQSLGSTESFVDDPSMFLETSPWHSTAGGEVYRAAPDVEGARKALAEAGYDGTPLRVLYRPSRDPHAELVRQQLAAAGINVTLQATDETSFTSRRADPAQWDLFLATGTSYSDPLTVVFLSSGFPGWWNTPAKNALMNRILSGADQAARQAAWTQLQELVWTDLPFVKLGFEGNLAVTSTRIGGFAPALGTVRGFYNVWLAR
ncbi:ABC transporter substrate-binding protein [Lentzea kentuckyensis]|uniref:ABC transporter substrate-binding protein n=1 Tax=Lentzea kentuckyensis TaxID=360086 RepID=UPI000A3CA3CC|nr:ABC transporter substrate-binding protein [Lentzea kentuckyensis]